MTAALELYPVSVSIAAGSRLRLTVAGTDRDNLYVPERDPVPVLTLFFGGPGGSRLDLPVEDAARRPEGRVIADAFGRSGSGVCVRKIRQPLNQPDQEVEMTHLIQQVIKGMILSLSLSLCCLGAVADDLGEQMEAYNMPDNVIDRFDPESRIPARGTVDSVRQVRAGRVGVGPRGAGLSARQLSPCRCGVPNPLDHRQQP